jgi:hypothetical protein
LHSRQVKSDSGPMALVSVVPRGAAHPPEACPFDRPSSPGRSKKRSPLCLRASVVDFFFFWRANKFTVPRRGPQLTLGGLQMFSLLFPSHRLAVNLAVTWLIPGCFHAVIFYPKIPKSQLNRHHTKMPKKDPLFHQRKQRTPSSRGLLQPPKVPPKNCGEEGRRQTVMSLTDRFSHPGPFRSGTIPLYACRVGTDSGPLAPVSVVGCDAALAPKACSFDRPPSPQCCCFKKNINHRDAEAQRGLFFARPGDGGRAKSASELIWFSRCAKNSWFEAFQPVGAPLRRGPVLTSRQRRDAVGRRTERAPAQMAGAGRTPPCAFDLHILFVLRILLVKQQYFGFISVHRRPSASLRARLCKKWLTNGRPPV